MHKIINNHFYTIKNIFNGIYFVALIESIAC